MTAAPAAAESQPRGPLLLVVDDHPTNRMVLQRLANLLGYPSEGAVIACTAAASADHEARCIAAGMDDCLIKPVTLATLRQCLNRWIPLPADDVAAAVAAGSSAPRP